MRMCFVVYLWVVYQVRCLAVSDVHPTAILSSMKVGVVEMGMKG